MGQADWADLFEQAASGLLNLDGDYSVTLANAYPCELVGRPRSELTGSKFYNLLSVAGRIFVQIRLWPELALAGRSEELALDLVKADGERVPILLNA